MKNGKIKTPRAKKTHGVIDRKRLVIILMITLGVLVIGAIVTLGVVFGKGWLAERKANGLLTAYEREILQTESNKDYSSAEINEDADAIEGYPVMAKLAVPSIDLALPVIERISDEALRVSVCYYSGAKLGEKGNMVITGHNFASGAHFGNLDNVKIDDLVELTAQNGQVYTYRVYEKIIITPQDAEALDVFEGEQALALLTCVYNGNRRLLVRCTTVAKE